MLFMSYQSHRLHRHLFCLLLGGLLTACQNPALSPPMRSTDQRMQLALGVAQSERVAVAETSLLATQAEYQRADNRLGEARAAFALGELYKSKRWQDQQHPPETINSYVRSADFYVQAAVLYQALNLPALAASSNVGAANAFLLADQLPQACDHFDQAQRLSADPLIQQDSTTAQTLARSLLFFNDLTAICAIRPR
jgi:hypothetical protein